MKPRRSRRTGGGLSAHDLVGVIQRTVERTQGPQGHPYGIAYIAGLGKDVNGDPIPGQAAIIRNGESVSDGGSYRVLRAYTSSTVGDEGGPEVGNLVLYLATAEGNLVILGAVGPDA